jgi:hypothetical protein
LKGVVRTSYRLDTGKIQAGCKFVLERNSFRALAVARKFSASPRAMK